MFTVTKLHEAIIFIVLTAVFAALKLWIDANYDFSIALRYFAFYVAGVVTATVVFLWLRKRNTARR